MAPGPDQRKWYYEACTLDLEPVMREIINLDTHSTIAMTSHLALGEAFGNCRMKGQDKLSALNDLIGNMGDKLKIVGNDGVHEIYMKLRNEFSRITETDLLHLATAIFNGCVQFNTADPDIKDLPSSSKRKIKEIAQEYNCSDFAIRPFEVPKVNKKKHGRK